MESLYTYSLKRTKTEFFTRHITGMNSFGFLKEEFGAMEQETMIVIHLNTKNIIIGYKQVTIGLVDRAHAHSREIFRHAIVANASKIVLAHNHPSGNLEPSAGDISLTKSMVEAGHLLGIPVLDHIIFSDEQTSSMRFNSYVEFADGLHS